MEQRDLLGVAGAEFGDVDAGYALVCAVNSSRNWRWQGKNNLSMVTFFRGAFHKTPRATSRREICGARQIIRRKADRMEDHQLQEL